MGCQSTYSPPITIPTGLTGPTGPTATDGTDGSSVLISGSGASSSTGNQVIATCTGTLTGGTIAAGDVLKYEAYCKFTESYLGTVYLNFGTEKILDFEIGEDEIFTPPIGETEFVLLLKGSVNFVTTSTENYVSSIEAVEDTVTTIINPVTNCSEDSASNITLSLGCVPTAGTLTASYFTVTKLTKV